MTVEEIIEALDAMEEGSDEEICHTMADGLLLYLLIQLGRDDVVVAYRRAKDRVHFWYA